MAERSSQPDDLDFVLIDALRDVVAEAPASPSAWAVLRARIERARRPVRPRPAAVVLGGLPPREWTLDWHLVSLGRMVR